MKQVKEYFHKLTQIIRREELRILPGNLAFFLVLSIVPIITLVGLICSLFSISLVDITNLLSELIPEQVEDMLTPFVSGTVNTGNLTWYFILGFLLASNGAHSIIVASNTLYHIKNQSYLKRRVKALFLTIILMFLFLFILIFLAFGNVILKFILGLKIFISIAGKIYSIFLLLKWPIATIMIFIMIKLLYTMAPDQRISSKYVNKGAAFTTIGWLLVTAIYSYYANNVANYNLFYGGLSGLVILMMWIYIIAYIFVIGIAINTNDYHYLEDTTVNKKEE